MVITANPLATAAGAEILAQGGTAADAMLAVQVVLGLVEHQSSGLGGGAFVVYYDAETGITTTIDAREKAPASATEDRFAGGLGFSDYWQSGQSVGVRGTPRMIEFGTSHVSIVDQYGNALSMTTTIESSFGNGVMVNGFLLNNELTDFSFAATDSTGVAIANRVQGNKRPRSSMSPTIVFDEDGQVEIVTGSPGGSRIIVIPRSQ
jgi:gamma-glutamyltranspeptidase